jgi:D-alanyl-D-alanine carboxypeptidase (penicillin-binding protein 5/6)
MMTALLVAESGRLDEETTVSERAAATPESSLNLKKGERITLRNLLYGIMLRSANDGCVAAAEALDGTAEAFVARMNARAKELGCRDTVFINPNGLHTEGHVSSARDLALIARAVLANPQLAEVVRTPGYTIERSISSDRYLKSRFRTFLLTYPGADGVKTGYTKQAGHCFVGSASRNGLHLISVVMKSPNVPADTRALLDWGFANYRGGAAAKAGQPVGLVKVSRGAVPLVRVIATRRADYVLPADAPPVRIVLPQRVKAPLKAGDAFGTARVMSGDRVLASFPVAAASPVPLSAAWKALRWLCAAGALAVGVVIIGAIAENTRRRRRRFKTNGRGTYPRGPGNGKRPGSHARRERRDNVGPHLR